MGRAGSGLSFSVADELFVWFIVVWLVVNWARDLSGRGFLPKPQTVLLSPARPSGLPGHQKPSILPRRSDKLRSMCPFNDQRVAPGSAIYGADRSGVVAALVSQSWGDVLQLADDDLVLALAQGVEGAPGLVRRCGAELRSWYVFSASISEVLPAPGFPLSATRPAPPTHPLPRDPPSRASPCTRARARYGVLHEPLVRLFTGAMPE